MIYKSPHSYLFYLVAKLASAIRSACLGCSFICMFVITTFAGSQIAFASSDISGAFKVSDDSSVSDKEESAINKANDKYVLPEESETKDKEDTGANDIIDTILDILTGLTCETQGVGNLLRTEFSHTCIPDSFLTFFIANILSPGLYANTFLRVTMNNDEMFPDACKRANRLDPKDPRMTFGMCSNIKLMIERVKAIARSAVAIASSIITGEAPWDKIKEAWSVPPQDYHQIYENRKEGDWEIFVDLGIIPIFPWKIIKDNDRLCVATVAFTGWIPIGCKYIKEPYPESIYHEFFNPHAPDPGYGKVVPTLTSCSEMGNCHYRAYEASRSVYTVSAPLIECIKEMVVKLMVSRKVCSFDDLDKITGTSARADSTFFQFQRNMHRVVMSLLTIYVIFFGFRILLSGNVPQKVEITNFVIKFIFVTYFSVGINVNVTAEDDYDRLDGMIQWALPFMLNGMTQVATWIINSTPSELCTFDAKKYAPGMQHIAVWDSLDCRISHYIGLDMIQTAVVTNANMQHDFSNFDVLSFPIPPYLYLLIPAIISGQMTLVMLALMYPLMVISVGAFVVYMTVVCIISIAILSILAPLFVPMFLFEFTKGYFESWAKLLLSFMLQPMVAMIFMTAMLAVYDFGFYGTCKYKSSEMEVVLSGGGKKTIQIFFVDNNWEKSYADEKEIYGCKNSLGYMLNNPFAALFDAAKTIITGGSSDDFPGLDPHKTGVESTDKYEFMGAVQESPGLFFSMFEVVFEWIRKFILSLLTAIITLYLMYHFSESLANFAADMTEGISIDKMSAISPQSIYKAGMSAVGSIGGAVAKSRSVSDKITGGGGGGAADKLSTGSSGGSGASDQISGGTPRAGATDKISTSGGGGGGGVGTAPSLPESGAQSHRDTASVSNQQSGINAPLPPVPLPPPLPPSNTVNNRAGTPPPQPPRTAANTGAGTPPTPPPKLNNRAGTPPTPPPRTAANTGAGALPPLPPSNTVNTGAGALPPKNDGKLTSRNDVNTPTPPKKPGLNDGGNSSN